MEDLKDGYLRPRDVERLFGIKSKTLQNWRYKGKGPPFYKLGHKLIVYKYEEVEKWLQKKTFDNIIAPHT